MKTLSQITMSEAEAREILGARYDEVRAAAEAWSRRSRRPLAR